MLNFLAAIHGTGVAASTNSYESIATVTPSGAASISFTSIPSTYKHLQIRVIAREGAGGISGIGYGYVRYNSDSAANYSWHDLYGTGAAAGAGGGGSKSNGLLAFAGSSTGASIFAANVVDILEYANTSINKTARSISGLDTNGAGEVALNSWTWYNTAAINRIDLVSPNGNWASGSSFALYGIKG